MCFLNDVKIMKSLLLFSLWLFPKVLPLLLPRLCAREFYETTRMISMKFSDSIDDN